MKKKVKKRKKQREVKPTILELYETRYKKYIFLGITLSTAILMICLITYSCADTTKINQNVNYEDKLIEEANQFDDIIFTCNVDNVEYDPDIMENGVYSIFYDGGHIPYQYQGGDFWAEQKDLETLNEETVFTDFSEREAKIIQSARNLVSKYIEDSDILNDKEWLIQKIQSVPFYKYTDTTHQELLSSFDAAAVHMGIGIYCNAAFSDYFCEYTVVHELIHHLRYLTSGESLYNEYYFAINFDEAMTDTIAYTMNPKLYDKRDMLCGYMFMHDPIYRYISVFEEDALEAYFYGYDEFFEKYGGETFKIEHDLFAVMMQTYDRNINSNMLCEGLFKSWEARY